MNRRNYWAGIEGLWALAKAGERIAPRAPVPHDLEELASLVPVCPIPREVIAADFSRKGPKPVPYRGWFFKLYRSPGPACSDLSFAAIRRQSDGTWKMNLLLGPHTRGWWSKRQASGSGPVPETLPERSTRAFCWSTW